VRGIYPNRFGGMMIKFNAEIEAAIRNEGEKAYPNECCGVLLGKFGGADQGDSSADESALVESIIPIENAHEADEQYHRFRIEAEDVMRAEKEARKQNKDVVGFYHSHPDHPAKPSEYDKNQALPFYSYIIVSVVKKKAADLTSWTLSPDRSEFLEDIIGSAN
jgi:proteasome lid subunit RPN8/RPN11